MADAFHFEVGDKEVEKVISILYQSCGIDFSEYSRESFTRRVQRIVNRDSKGDFESLIEQMSSNKPYLDTVVKEVTVNVTEMFRDPTFFLALRNNIIPELQKKREFRLWHAGCSTGEEIYSMATLLHESNILSRSVIHGTDLNSDVLKVAKNRMLTL